ncbi:MAG: hypothetical protein HC897_01055 [Thermoanaerobaculia bacterium]|nr:hypothetical protein [Thermoanaerobaculia bacterium]
MARSALPDSLFRLQALAEEIPWQRVINAQGEISLRAEPGCEGLQRALLEAEGVVFNAAGKVDLKRFGWRG